MRIKMINMFKVATIVYHFTAVKTSSNLKTTSKQKNIRKRKTCGDDERKVYKKKNWREYL